MKEPVILMCAKVTGKLLLPDNLTGPCDVCGATVQYRPHAPTPHILRCMGCVAALIEPGDTFSTTQRMLDDAAEYFRKRKQ